MTDQQRYTKQLLQVISKFNIDNLATALKIPFDLGPKRGGNKRFTTLMGYVLDKNSFDSLIDFIQLEYHKLEGTNWKGIEPLQIVLLQALYDLSLIQQKLLIKLADISRKTTEPNCCFLANRVRPQRALSLFIASFSQVGYIDQISVRDLQKFEIFGFIQRHEFVYQDCWLFELRPRTFEISNIYKRLTP